MTPTPSRAPNDEVRFDVVDAYGAAILWNATRAQAEAFARWLNTTTRRTWILRPTWC